MDKNEYKERKFDKLTRDTIRTVNAVPSFGYGEVADAIAKAAMSSYLLTLLRAVEVSDADADIFIQSVIGETTELAHSLIFEFDKYKDKVEGAE